MLGLVFVVALPGLARALDSVLVVSIDALHPAALDPETAPTLYRLMQSGHYTLKGRSVDPPKTLIAHTAMFTGLPPEKNGKRDNDWQPGQPRVGKPTLLDDAKRQGYRTAFFYAKAKLGYLVNDAVDEQAWSPDDGIDRAAAFFHQPGRRFAVLHLSGLEYAGTESGWLSPPYRDALSYIDLELSDLLEKVGKRGRHLIIITSDHAGHDRLHGTRHPEDYKLPLIAAGSNVLAFPQGGVYQITELRGLLAKVLGWGTPREK
jgi:predicted AlkP superfamily pyrophosphatase or phosphodiesterase